MEHWSSIASEVLDDKTAFAVTLVNRRLYDSIYDSFVMEYPDTKYTYANIVDMLENKPVFTRLEKVLFVYGLKCAWSYVLNTLDQPINIAYMKKIHSMVGERDENTLTRVRTSREAAEDNPFAGQAVNGDEVRNKLASIEAIEDPKERAYELYTYIVSNGLFINNNIHVAGLLANKILVGSGVGILSVVPTKNGENFESHLEEATIAKYSESLHKYLEMCTEFI